MPRRDLDTYIVLQRACGLKFTTQSGLLRIIVTVAEAAGDTDIRTDRAIDWAARTVSGNQACNRLAIVLRLGEHLAILIGLLAATGAPSRGTCWRCPPIWAMPIPATPDDTCKRPRR